jgi:hypothetical protein
MGIPDDASGPEKLKKKQKKVTLKKRSTDFRPESGGQTSLSPGKGNPVIVSIPVFPDRL